MNNYRSGEREEKAAATTAETEWEIKKILAQ